MTNLQKIAALLAGMAAACAPSAGMAASYVVTIEGMEYSPASLDVAVGDTITWVNHDVVPHTATAAGGAWDSGSIDKDGEWSMTVEAAGSISYACTFHPQMTGVINAR